LENSRNILNKIIWTWRRDGLEKPNNPRIIEQGTSPNSLKINREPQMKDPNARTWNAYGGGYLENTFFDASPVIFQTEHSPRPAVRMT
jgi:hypothetical protein